MEQFFRMSKFEPEVRPIYHQNESSIQSHVLKCFAALVVKKILERKTNLSLRKIRALVWDINESQIQDSVTGNIYKFPSLIKEILMNP